MKVRKIARVLVEAAVPLAVGSGEGNIMTDASVAVDFNGMPYIPGTAVAGVIRNALAGHVYLDAFFGQVNGTVVEGSRLVVSDAKIVDFHGNVVDGMVVPDAALQSLYSDCPVRHHTSIDGRGVARNRGKFDNQVVYRGTRFCFDLEGLIESDDDMVMFDAVLQVVNKGLRVGAGTRNGYGRIETVSIWTIDYDLDSKEGIDGYLNHSARLCIDASALKEWKLYENDTDGLADGVISMTLVPEDFIFFGSGFGNENADAVQLTERYVSWDGAIGKVELGIVIPGTAVKGAFAHRFEYWYNALDMGNGAQARKVLFGSVDDKTQSVGLIYFDDVIAEIPHRKVFNHVKIDRFTGGAFPGALYNEEAVYAAGCRFTFSIRIDEEALKKRCDIIIDYDKVKHAVGLVISDIGNGLLPLGGLTNRGHGCFTML